MEYVVSGIFSIIGILIAWYVLQVIAGWKILSKAGKPGWFSLIPFLNVWAEYEICWNGLIGIVYCILLGLASSAQNGQDVSSTMQMAASAAAVAAVVLHIVQSVKLAKAFGKGLGFGILLILFGPLARLALGLGSSRYIGKP